MGRKKLPINILIDEINNIRENKIPKKYHKKLKEHLDKNKIHKSIFEQGEYSKLAKILSFHINFWKNKEK